MDRLLWAGVQARATGGCAGYIHGREHTSGLMQGDLINRVERACRTFCWCMAIRIANLDYNTLISPLKAL